MTDSLDSKLPLPWRQGHAPQAALPLAETLESGVSSIPCIANPAGNLKIPSFANIISVGSYSATSTFQLILFGYEQSLNITLIYSIRQV